MIDYRALFERSLPYDEFLRLFGSTADTERWRLSFEKIRLTPSQRELIASFRRRMYVLCMAGAWCGDCVRQCPVIEHCARASTLIELRFFDRDAESAAAQQLTICGSPRVPQAIFLSEDFEFVARFGDRTLSQYRHIYARLSGAACASGLAVPNDPFQPEMIAEWVAEIERAQLILRTSPKLRDRHGD